MATPTTDLNSSKSNLKEISDSTRNCNPKTKSDKKIPLLKVAKSPYKKPFKRTYSIPVNRQNGNLPKVPRGITVCASVNGQDSPCRTIAPLIINRKNDNPATKTPLLKSSRPSSFDCPNISTPKDKSHSASISSQNNSTTKEKSFTDDRPQNSKTPEDTLLLAPTSTQNDNTTKTCLTALAAHQLFTISKGTPSSRLGTPPDSRIIRKTLASVSSQDNNSLNQTILATPISLQNRSTTKRISFMETDCHQSCSSSNKSYKTVPMIKTAGSTKIIPCSMAMCPHCLKRIPNKKDPLLEHFISTHPRIGTMIIKRHLKYAMIMDHEFPLNSNTCITMMKMHAGPSIGLITLWLMLSRYEVLYNNTRYQKFSVWMLTECTKSLYNAKIRYAGEGNLVRVRTLKDMTSFKEIVKDERCLDLSLTAARKFLDRRGGTIMIQVH